MEFFLSVVDCQVTPWGPWSACDTDCGPGTMSRTRTVQIQPENGGRHCPSLEQRRGCQVSNCHHHPDPAIKGKLMTNRLLLNFRLMFRMRVRKSVFRA